MFWLSLILLILLGVLGIASWLKGRQPRLGGTLGQLETAQGWVGLIGLIWGVVLLLRWLSTLSLFGVAPGFVLIALATALVITALSLILALPQMKTLFGSNGFTNTLGNIATKLAPFKIGLGFACLILALYMLLMLLRVL